MKHYLSDTQIVHDRMRDITRTVEAHRLARLAQVYRPGVAGRILAGLGGWMVNEGTRLKMRYAAEMELNRQQAKIKVIGY
jgi:hypothetical protein